MSLFDLKNNALFLACFRERFRPVQIWCFIGLIISILVLSYFSIVVNENDPAKILKHFLEVVASTQFFVLIIQGTLFAWHMGSRERSSETLDFHRSSPELAESKVLGLIFGSTWFEWIVFAALFVLEGILALLIGWPFMSIVLFNVSLIVSALFFHSAGVMFSLLTTSKTRRIPLIGLLIIGWFLSPLVLFAGESSDLFIYLFGASGFAYIFEAFENLSGYFYTIKFPFIVVQFLVQAPLTLLLLNGIRRIFCKPNSPAWSKKDVLRFSACGLFLLVGFFVGRVTLLGTESGFDELLPNYYHSPHSYYYTEHFIENFFGANLGFFVIVTALMGMVLAWCFTPSYFNFSKYVVLKRHNKLSGPGLFHEGFSSLPSVIVYSVLTAVFACFYFVALQVPWIVAGFLFLLFMSYVFAFNGFVEYYRLSKFRSNRVLFVTVLALVWAIIPWMVGLMVDFDWDRSYLITTLSPFSGLWYSLDIVGKNMFEKTAPIKWLALVGPLLTAVLASGFAWNERRRVRETVSATVVQEG